MLRFRQTRLAAYVAVMLLVTMYIAPVAQAAKTSPAPVQPKTVVVMPFEVPADCPLATLGTDMSQSVAGSLAASGTKAIELSDRLPSIRRAYEVDKSIRKEDVRGPFGTDTEQIQTALKIAKETSADYMLVGSVDDVTVDTAAKTAVIGVTATMVDIKTGETVNTEVISGKTAANANSEIAANLVAQAGADAVSKIVVSMSSVVGTQPGTIVVTRKKHSNKMLWIVGAIIVGAGVAIALTNNNDDTPLDGPPPPPGT